MSGLPLMGFLTWQDYMPLTCPSLNTIVTVTRERALIAVNSLCDLDKSLNLVTSTKVTSSLMKRIVPVFDIVTASEIDIRKTHFSVTKAV